ncbi:hypothetical protein GCM10009838_22900 [Catenulispora subtropica]|uniref:Uncharacterized protein n=2 Tax=Catenulispora subtropica TaxID=450798 RepID=A0ABN2R7M2_9ACTN
MIASALAAPTGAIDHHRLLPALDAAARASADAHDVTRALTDTVLACQHLPAEVYQYAPHLSQATEALTAASRTLTTVTGYATANPMPDNVHALHRATAELAAATAALRYQTAALATAAAWHNTPAALSPSQRATSTFRRSSLV